MCKIKRTGNILRVSKKTHGKCIAAIVEARESQNQPNVQMGNKLDRSLHVLTIRFYRIQKLTLPCWNYTRLYTISFDFLKELYGIRPIKGK